MDERIGTRYLRRGQELDRRRREGASPHHIARARADLRSLLGPVPIEV